MPDEGKAHGKSAVGAEDLDGRKGTNDAEPEGNHVGDGGDRDGDRCLGERLRHAKVHRLLRRGASPGGQHDERVIDSDACGLREELRER